MKYKRIRGQALLAKSLILGTLILSASSVPGWAIDPADDAGVFGSITLARQAREGAKALNAGDFGKAMNAYRNAIEQKADIPELYYGLLYAGQKAGAWDQVTRALDSISEKDPSAKLHLAFEIGNCYTNTGRYDEAVPMLKAALASGDKDQNFLSKKVSDLLAMTAKPAPAVVLSPEEQAALNKRIEDEKKAINAKPVKRKLVRGEDENIYSMPNVGSNYKDAFLRSEWIGIGEYKGYDKKQYILWTDPPIAHFKLVKCLNGPPLNPDLPIRFRFNEYDGEPKPAGWKFTPDKMPAKGSRWIIFIMQAVPRENAFDTYRGRYGRQEFNEDNLGKIMEQLESHHGQQ